MYGTHLVLFSMSYCTILYGFESGNSSQSTIGRKHCSWIFLSSTGALDGKRRSVVRKYLERTFSCHVYNPREDPSMGFRRFSNCSSSNIAATVPVILIAGQDGHLCRLDEGQYSTVVACNLRLPRILGQNKKTVDMNPMTTFLGTISFYPILQSPSSETHVLDVF